MCYLRILYSEIKVNIKKTKVLVVRWNRKEIKVNIEIFDNQTEQVKQFCYHEIQLLKALHVQ